MESKVKCPHSISQTCLAEEFGLVCCQTPRTHNVDLKITIGGLEESVIDLQQLPPFPQLLSLFKLSIVIMFIFQTQLF